MTAKARLIQTFNFLKELNELRNPVPRDLSGLDVLRLDTWPAHPCVQVRRGDRQEDDSADSAEIAMEPLIRIARAQLTPCPKPPEILDGWLKPGWQSIDEEVRRQKQDCACYGAYDEGFARVAEAGRRRNPTARTECA